MNLIFFIQSKTVHLDKFTIKDLPGSSGRFDVICRCILAALGDIIIPNVFIQIWVFLPRYGTFVFNERMLNLKTFPKNELLLAKKFKDYIYQTDQELKIEKNSLTIFEAIDTFMKKGNEIILLSEFGQKFNNFFLDVREISTLLCIIGDQTGELINSSELKGLNLPHFSFGKKSYLASSVIRLVKIALMNSRKNFKF
jgi:tRNA pseudouridine-54 N-methylase